jgi:hypothetical protein
MNKDCFLTGFGLPIPNYRQKVVDNFLPIMLKHINKPVTRHHFIPAILCRNGCFLILWFSGSKNI